MDLALVVLTWTGAVSLALITMVTFSHIAARTDLVKAKTANEKRLH